MVDRDKRRSVKLVQFFGAAGHLVRLAQVTPRKGGNWRSEVTSVAGTKAKLILAGSANVVHSISDDGEVSEKLGYLSGSFAGNCEDPIVMEHVAVQFASPRDGTVEGVYFTVRCRKCEACRRSAAAHWAARTYAEVEQARRSWFVTLTLGPAARSRWGASAVKRAGGRARYASLCKEEQAGHWMPTLGPVLQKYLKRIRRHSPFRFIAAVEGHADGTPHVHMIICEYKWEALPSLNRVQNAIRPIGERTIRKLWGAGFSEARLVKETDNQAPWYVCKYISKGTVSRVRASQSWGLEKVVDAKMKSTPFIAERPATLTTELTTPRLSFISVEDTFYSDTVRG